MVEIEPPETTYKKVYKILTKSYIINKGSFTCSSCNTTT